MAEVQEAAPEEGEEVAADNPAEPARELQPEGDPEPADAGHQVVQGEDREEEGGVVAHVLAQAAAPPLAPVRQEGQEVQEGEEAAARDQPLRVTHQQRLEVQLAEVDRDTRRALGQGAPVARQEEQEAGEVAQVQEAGEEGQGQEEQGPVLQQPLQDEDVLSGWVDPHIPEPGISPELEPDGWDLVDRVGAWDTFLCEFRVLQFVPWQHRETWACAWAEVLKEDLGGGGQGAGEGAQVAGPPTSATTEGPQERGRSWQG